MEILRLRKREYVFCLAIRSPNAMRGIIYPGSDPLVQEKALLLSWVVLYGVST